LAGDVVLKSEKRSGFLQRSRIDIMACILENSNDKSRKTRLIYRCNLSLSQFNIYKDCLVDTGLLDVARRGDGVEIFGTTEKGKEFLTDYRKIKSVMDEMRI